MVADRVVPTPDYVRFASHYRFRPDFCQGHDPESKGIVENLVGYAKTDLMVGVGLVELTGPVSVSAATVAAANKSALRWCTEVIAATHSEIAAVPAQRLAGHELGLLAGLPSLRPALGGPAVTRKVDRLSCVRFGSARYSVPTVMIGHRVELRTHGDRLTIGDSAGTVLAEHTLVGPGEASVLDAHYGSARPATPARAVRPKTPAEKAFCALGPVAEGFLTGAAAAGHTRLGVELDELLALAAAHGQAPLLDALSRATAFRRWRAVNVRSILAAGAAAPRPRPAGDALIVDLPQVPTRSLADYALPPGRTPEPVTGPTAAGDAS